VNEGARPQVARGHSTLERQHEGNRRIAGRSSDGENRFGVAELVSLDGHDRGPCALRNQASMMLRTRQSLLEGEEATDACGRRPKGVGLGRGQKLWFQQHAEAPLACGFPPHIAVRRLRRHRDVRE